MENGDLADSGGGRAEDSGGSTLLLVGRRRRHRKRRFLEVERLLEMDKKFSTAAMEAGCLIGKAVQAERNDSRRKQPRGEALDLEIWKGFSGY